MVFSCREHPRPVGAGCRGCCSRVSGSEAPSHTLHIELVFLMGGVSYGKGVGTGQFAWIIPPYSLGGKSIMRFLTSS